MSVNQINKQLQRSNSDRMIAGICGGIATYFGLDASLVRFIFILIILLGGSGLLIYLILWLILPEELDESDEKTIKMNKTTHTKIMDQDTEKSSKKTWGLLLIGIGMIMLLQNFGYTRFLQLDKTWPTLLIVFGLLILSKKS